MKATSKQLSLIAFKLEQLKNDYVWITDLFNETPRNNEKYPDERCDYKRMILADRLSDITSAQADYVIRAYGGEYGYHQLKARNILMSIIK